MKNVDLIQITCQSVLCVNQAINLKMENVKRKVCVLNSAFLKYLLYFIYTSLLSLSLSLSLSLPPSLPSPTGGTSASTSSCDTGCIIGIVLAILGAIILSIVVVLVVYAVYRYLSNPATKLAKTGTEGLNG